MLLLLFLAVCSLSQGTLEEQTAAAVLEDTTVVPAAAAEEDVVVNSSTTLEGVEMEETVVLNGTTLTRNGEGVRSVPFLGFAIKVYVAGMYASRPLRNERDVLDYQGPLHFDFTFLRNVGQARVTEAWQRQLEASVSHHYEGYEKDRDDFIRMFGPIEKNGTETVKVVGNETQVVDQGQVKGVIRGHHFRRAFLSMWFGERCVAADLKAGLLGLSRLEPGRTSVC